MVSEIMPALQLILSVGNVCILGYALFKFISKPHDTLETRVTTVELKVSEIESYLKQGNDRFRELYDTSEVLLRTTIALIDFEIQYCLTENKPLSKDLEKAREELHTYLSRK